MARWLLRQNDANIELMSKTLGIGPVFSYVLANRGIRTKKTAQQYLRPSVDALHDTLLLKDAKKAIELLSDSIARKERIVIYGDYDADGVMSTVILHKALQRLGADVSYYIPHREFEGYGLNHDTALKLCDAGYDVVVTCDNGISALEEVKLLKSCGMKVVIIDHHEPGFVEGNGAEGQKMDVVPIADATIDPKQQACPYPFKSLCAAGLCYKFTKALFAHMKKEFTLDDELLVCASVATICDIVDLVSENRALVKKGLSLINSKQTLNIGLQALLIDRELTEKEISTYHIGFIIGPCINASGRLESATLAVKLFLSTNMEEALVLAKRLSAINDERKELTAKAVVEVSTQAAQFENDKILVIYNDNIHESIAGIVAGRMKDTYDKPAIVITKSDQMTKGSGRSIEGYDLFKALCGCRDLLARFGGHYMAAGLSLKEENIEPLRLRLNENCTLQAEDFEKIIRIDKELKLSDVSKTLAHELCTMEPFGKENKEALFITKNVLTERVDFVGANKTIIQMTFVDENNRKLKGICFDGFDTFKEGLQQVYPPIESNKILNNLQKKISLYLDIVYKVEINLYNNNEYLQLNVVDFKFS